MATTPASPTRGSPSPTGAADPSSSGAATPPPTAANASAAIPSVRSFLAAATSTYWSSAPATVVRAATDEALSILEAFPGAGRTPVLAFCASLADACVAQHVRCVSAGSSAQSSNGHQTLSLTLQLNRLVGQNGRDESKTPSPVSLLGRIQRDSVSWASPVASWALATLGDLSSKYAVKLFNAAVASGQSTTSAANGGMLHETLPLWLECPAARTLLNVAAECLETLLAVDEEGDANVTLVKEERRRRRQKKSRRGHPEVDRQRRERGAEDCVASLLDLSARHTPHFDWVVAHLGACFPATVVTRVIHVGLREFCQSAEAQASKGNAGFALSRVPKLNSVVGILGHLASAHPDEVRRAIRQAITPNLGDQHDRSDANAAAAAMDDLDTARIPFLLYLASLSEHLRRATLSVDFLRATVLAPAKHRSSPAAIDVVAALAQGRWQQRYFPESDSLIDLATHLSLQSDDDDDDGGLFGLLLELGGDGSTAGPAARAGCRALAERLLCELQIIILQRRQQMAQASLRRSQTSPTGEEVGLLRSLTSTYRRGLLEKFFLTGDEFQRRSTLTILSYLAAHIGQRLVVDVICFCLLHSEDDQHLAAMVEFLREAEAIGALGAAFGTDGPVTVAVSKAVRDAHVCWSQKRSQTTTTTNDDSGQRSKESQQLLKNLVRLLIFEAQQRQRPPHGKLVFGFQEATVTSHNELLEWLSMAEQPLARVLLRLLRLSPLQAEAGAPMVHRAARCLTKAFFLALQAEQDAGDLAKTAADFAKALLDVSLMPTGLPMVLRFLLEGALDSSFCFLFGGKPLTEEDSLESSSERQRRSQRSQRGKLLLDENLRFGSMPTHPLGATTVFHSGVIGDGKRNTHERVETMDKEKVELNQFTFLTVLFKICYTGGDNEKERESRARDATRQLALMLVEMVSPDVMYNGLPWPEEDFATRVTPERDLRMHRAFTKKAPILWKLLGGLAEARPALCYCSVLLRALLAVQMAFWGGSTAVVRGRAEDHPEQLETLRKTLELMSVGQYLPHPLNALPDVVAKLHPFHVHCILQDVWAFMRDHVPSPVEFEPRDKDVKDPSGPVIRDFKEDSGNATPAHAGQADTSGAASAANGADTAGAIESAKNVVGSPYRAYSERLRLTLIHLHLSELSDEFRRFFVDSSSRKEQDLQMAMDY